jgi:TATA-box binding protein (TBP) (component of TFIID and TFIIIB)
MSVTILLNEKNHDKEDINKNITKIDYKVSTITMTMQIPDCQFNLNNIGRYLDIDDTILGIKYHYGNGESIIKGKYLTAIYKKSKSKNENKINKKLFYNQVSLIIKHIGKDKDNKNCDENIVNVKIFGNGSLHLTGVKNTLEGQEIVLILYKKLEKFKNTFSTILLTKDTNGVYLDSSNNVYSTKLTNKTTIGYKLNSLIYVINKKEYYITDIDIDIDSSTKKLRVFMSNKLEAKRTRNILNMDGKNIGYSKINLIRNKSKLYKNNSNIHFDKNFIFYDGNGTSTIIGNISYEITQAKLIENEIITKNLIEYNYSCNPFITEPLQEKLNDINNLNMNVNTINIYFKLDFELNRQRLFNKLLELNYITEYTPEKYSGVKLTYKINQNYLNDGKCLCNNKCTCNNITFLIFQSGNIIVTGFKNINDIIGILKTFKDIINKISNTIIKKTFV